MPSPLDALVGHWRTEGLLVADPATRVIGTDTYAWMPGGAFLVHVVDVVVGGLPVCALELIGEHDPVTGSWTARSFDADGGMATMRATVDTEGTWTFTGGADAAEAAQPEGYARDGAVRATLRVAEDRSRMHALWERCDDGATWEPWMDVRFTRLPDDAAHVIAWSADPRGNPT